jgi:hypothetical protein
VLCVPGRARTIAAARASASSTQQTRTLAVEVLDSELHAFSTRNVGRICRVEMDRDDFSAHLAHCESVHLLTANDGRDQVMRIVHAGGQTLLLLE